MDPITEQIERQDMKDQLRTNPSAPMGLIVEAVSKVTLPSVEELIGPRRSRTIAYPRFICYDLMKKFCWRNSLVQIGQFMGGRDHTTIIHGLRRAEELLAGDREFAYDHNLALAEVRRVAEVRAWVIASQAALGTLPPTGPDRERQTL